jgi:hypothetical protein
VHCIVTGGGLSLDHARWVATSAKYLFPLPVMAKLLRGKMLCALRRAHRRRELRLPDDLVETSGFDVLIDTLFATDWVVYAKPPFGGPPYDFDMDDAHPLTDTSMWYDDVIAAKNDDPEALVVIGFIPWMNINCVFGGESPNLIAFVDSFGKQGVKASICEPDFGPIFASTIETIVTTCENFDPPG